MTRAKKTEAFKAVLLCLGGVVTGATILGVLGVPSCGEIQTVKAADKAEKRNKEEHSEFEAEHQYFRQQLWNLNQQQNENYQEILKQFAK